MEIRLLNANELSWAVQTAMEVYTTTIMPYAQTPEEIEVFRRYVNEDHLWVELCKKKLYLWGAFEHGQMCGVSAMESTGRITMLYVTQAYRMMNCEQLLRHAMEEYGETVLSLPHGAVQVSLLHPQYQTAQGQAYGQGQAYAHGQPYGQSRTYAQGQPYGQSRGYAQTPKKRSYVWAVVLAFCLLPILAGAVIYVVIGNIRTEINFPVADVDIESDPFEVPLDGSAELWEGGSDLDWMEELGGDHAEETSVNGHEVLADGLGTEMIVPRDDIYIEDDIAYTVSAEYISVPQVNNENLFQEFTINYPQISYTDGRSADEVNGILRDCACLWMDKMYPKPDMEQLLDDEERPYFASDVDYEITWMSNELLCVAFEDHYFPGSIYYEAADLRTRVINLETGETYDLENLITHDTALDQLYYEKICEGENDFVGAEAFDVKKAGATLDGDYADSRYYSNFIISDSGVKINLTYHYGDGSLIMRGWVSTDYTSEELEGYRKENSFWDLYEGR